MSDTPRLILERYQLGEVIGEGAFGVVSRAFDTRLKRPVAIKSLKRSMADTDPGHFRLLEDRFTREAEAGSRTGSHPNLVTVFDLAIDTDGTRYLVLEYVAGGTLSERLTTNGALSLTDTLRLTADIARGLHAAHTAGIVHRDVKPANIFLAADGRAQVGDFGIAQIDNLSRRTHFSFGHPGTPLYMSPEQAGSTAYVRPISDEYSLGLVLFEMLTGEVYRRIGRRDATALLERQPNSILELVTRMLEDDPDDRYHTLGAVEIAVLGIERRWSSLTTDGRRFNRATEGHTAPTPPHTRKERTLPPFPVADGAKTNDAYANMLRPGQSPTAVPESAPLVAGSPPPAPPAGADTEGRDRAPGVWRRIAWWMIPVILLLLLAVGIAGSLALRNGGAHGTATPIQATGAPSVVAATVTDGTEQYSAGQNALARGDYAGAADAFTQAGAYRDAPQQASLTRTLADQQTAYDAGITALDRKAYAQAAQSFMAAGQIKDAPRAYAYSLGFIALASEAYTDATTDFVAAGDFRDAATQRQTAADLVAKKQAYDAGAAAAAKSDWGEATKQYTAAGSFKDAPQQLQHMQQEQGLETKYNDAQALLKQSKYAEAYSALVEIEKTRPDYRDVANILTHLRGDVANPITLDIAALNQSTDVVGFVTPINNLIGQPIAYLRVVRTFSYRSAGAPNVVSGLGVDLIPSGDPNAPKASPTTPVFVAADEQTYRDNAQPGEQIVAATPGATDAIAEYGPYKAQFTIKDVATSSNVKLPGNQQARFPVFTKLVIQVTLQLK